MRLKTRLALSFVLYTVLVLILFGATYYFFESRSIRQAQSEEQSKAVAGLAQVCKGMHVALNPIVAVKYATELGKDPVVLKAFCVDQRGVIQAHSDSQEIGRKYMQENLIESTERQLPVLVGGEQVGMAFVLYKTRGLEQQVQTKLLTTLGQLMSVSVSTFFLAIIAGIWMATGISRPILKLVEAAQAIGSGQLDYQTTLSLRHDELGTLAQEMEAMSKKLKQLDEIKDDFVASVSHDLRAPLAAIYSYADAILEGTYGPAAAGQMKAVEYILTSARSLNLMVDNVLDLAKIKAGSVHLNAKSVNMKELIEREIGLYALLAEKNQIALATNFNAAGPNVYGDAQSISRVLNNLVFNALKFTPSEGRITVATRTEGAQLRVDVHNTGTSISAENLNRLFHRFEPLEKNSSASKGFVGTGLGLSVVKQLVELNGGQVSAHSAEGQGVTFSFTLPVGK